MFCNRPVICFSLWTVTKGLTFDLLTSPGNEKRMPGFCCKSEKSKSFIPPTTKDIFGGKNLGGHKLDSLEAVKNY